MVAYDSRRVPDPSQLLRQETVDELRAALAAQARARAEPTERLANAIRAAAHEARERTLQPEALIIQIKQLADDAGLLSEPDQHARSDFRTWMVRTLLQAYFDPDGIGA
jgi:hypothetical protein